MAITVDAISDSGAVADVTSITKAHTVSSGDNRCLVVCVQLRDATVGGLVTGITYDGSALTVAKMHTDNVSQETTYIYYLVAPAVKTANVVVSFSETINEGNCTIVSLFGVKQTSPVDATNGQHVSALSSSLAVTPSVAGSIVIDAVYTTDNNITMGADQTSLANHGVNTNGDWIGASYERADGERTMSWSWSGANGTNASHSVASFLAAVAAGPALLKTVNGLAVASVKTLRSGLAIASGKTFNGLA
jgi:hypothetical protein